MVAILSWFLLGNAAYLHLRAPTQSILPTFFQGQLVAHVLAGFVLLGPLAAFSVLHGRSLWRMGARKAVATGLVLVLTSILLAVTGTFILTKANSANNQWAFVSHQVLALVGPALFLAHRLLGRNRITPRSITNGLIAVGGLVTCLVLADDLTRPEPPPERASFIPPSSSDVDVYRDLFPPEGVSGAPQSSVFFPAATRSQTGRFLSNRILTNGDLPEPELLKRDLAKHGFAVESRIGSESCARCHQDIVEQWAGSAHRFASFNNPFYRVAIESLRKEPDGKVRSQWCSGCHDPAIMMPGNMTREIDPMTAEAQAGLTCIACHAMDEVHGVGGNGNYRIADASPDPYLFPEAKSGPLAFLHDSLIKSKPDVHRREMKKPVFSTSEYCGTCHKVSLDTPVNSYRWIRGQNEYDAHQDSGVSRNNARTFYLPDESKNCQDCHMPRVDAVRGDLAAKDGKVRSHRFPGPNTALPHVRGDKTALEEAERFLRGSLRVDIAAVKDGSGNTVLAPDLRPIALRSGDSVEIQVVVRNSGVGHTFPGGTTDSNEAWIHFVITEAISGRVLAESGAVDPVSLGISEDAHRYRTVFVDEQGKEIARREPHRFRAIAHQKLIGPGTADVARYSWSIPADAPSKIKVRATVRWRKFSPSYTEYAWRETMPGRPVPVLPITDVASAETTFDISTRPTEPSSIQSEHLRRDWMRWNDLGIGLMLQGDTRGAKHAFGIVADARPDLADGPRNLARTLLEDGAPQDAIEQLKVAESRSPASPLTAYWFGVARERASQLPEALSALRFAQESFPRDRTIHQRIGQIYYRLGDFELALKSFLVVLSIDPEDRMAHYNRMLTYRAMGQRDAADEAEKAYLKYQIDESAQKWTNSFRRERPDVNHESQPLHVHPLGAPK